jgi:hypothetical protein
MRSGIAAAAVAAGISILAAGPTAARASVGFFIGAGPPVYYAPPPPPPPVNHAPSPPRGYYPPPAPYSPPMPRWYHAPPPAYHYWPY